MAKHELKLNKMEILLLNNKIKIFYNELSIYNKTFFIIFAFFYNAYNYLNLFYFFHHL